jgi:hypothetical protein
MSQALSLHVDDGMTSPYLADMNHIKIMTHAVKKYKTVPKHKEMISDSMFHHIAALSQRPSGNSFVQAVVNWITLGCYTGFRKS